MVKLFSDGGDVDCDCSAAITAGLHQLIMETRLRKLCETQIEVILGYDDTDMLPGSYPHRKYMVCMV